MSRTSMETAFGGMMLGMAMPLALFGFGVVIDTADLLELRAEPLVMPFGAIIFLGAVMLGTAGGTLLWGRRQPRAAQVPAVRRPVLQRARRREVAMVQKPVIQKPVIQKPVIQKPVLVKLPVKRAPAPAHGGTFSDHSLVTLTPVLGRDGLSTAQLPLGESLPEATTKLVPFGGTQRKIRIVA